MIFVLIAMPVAFNIDIRIDIVSITTQWSILFKNILCPEVPVLTY